MAATIPWDDALAAELAGRRSTLPGALLPILHDVQATFGYIDDRAVPILAEALNISKAEVVGVIHFYHDFRTEPPGDHILRVCRAEACQSMGCESLVAHLSARLNVEPGQTSDDRRVTFDSVYCLGNCALSPAVMLDGALFGRVTPGRAERILAEAGL